MGSPHQHLLAHVPGLREKSEMQQLKNENGITS
jgi:hypothetical protein